MAIEIAGVPNPQNLTSLTVSEDITPLDPNSSSGGYGQIQFQTEAWDRYKALLGTDVTLTDSETGNISGTVRDLNYTDGDLAVTADSELGKFNVRRGAEPYSGPLSGYVQYLMDLAGLFTSLDYQTNDYTIHVPGFIGNVWDHVKWLMSAHQKELALVADSVVVRDLRQHTADTVNLIADGFTVNRQTSALAVDMAYYNYHPITKGEVYPVPGEEPSVQSVDAGETITFDLNIHASLKEVYQPVPMVSVGPGDRSGTNGAYTIVGKDNLPIQPSQWRAAGGSLVVEVTEEPGVLKVTLTGAHIEHLGPFRIAESAGGHDFNSLHITGDGVAWEERALRLYTGADPFSVSNEVGATVDNPYISTMGQAFNAGFHTAAAYSGSKATISGTLTSLRGEDQLFGNLVGARVRVEDAFYRIESIDYSPGTIGFTAVMDTTVADFNELWAGKTMEEFNSSWEEMTVRDFNLMPLYQEDTSSTMGYGNQPYGEEPYGGAE